MTSDRGDVVELCDGNGDAFAAYRYDPWGVPTSTVTQSSELVDATLAAEIAARQVLRYAGYVYDADIGTASCGTYYLSARHYDPATRQFISKDPAKADGEESAYQYCGGDPVNKSDASGLWGYSWKIYKYGIFPRWMCLRLAKAENTATKISLITCILPLKSFYLGGVNTIWNIIGAMARNSYYLNQYSKVKSEAVLTLEYWGPRVTFSLHRLCVRDIYWYHCHAMWYWPSKGW